MKRKICAVISVILIIASLVVFAYPDISKTENQKKNDEITERFDHVADGVQDGSREEAEDNGEVNEDGYLIDDNGVIISEYPVVYQADIDRLIYELRNISNKKFRFFNNKQHIELVERYYAVPVSGSAEDIIHDLQQAKAVIKIKNQLEANNALGQKY